MPACIPNNGRPSYINAILIASRGVPAPEEIFSHTRNQPELEFD